MIGRDNPAAVRQRNAARKRAVRMLAYLKKGAKRRTGADDRAGGRKTSAEAAGDSPFE